ncbi:hypothetical protein [Paenibacillus sp.]
MSKRTQRRRITDGNGLFFLCLGLLAVFFLAGMIFGQSFAKDNASAVAAELRMYLMEYISLGSNEECIGPVFLSALLIYFRYPLVAVFLGYLLPGALVLPFVSGAFGFSLSYAACCFIKAFGEIGILVAAAVFGLRCLISIPCFFILAVPALQRAMNHLFERSFGFGKRLQASRPGLEWWLVACIVAAVLLAGALAEVFLAPVLLRNVVQIL